MFRSCALGDFVVSVPLLRRLADPLVVAHGEHLELARAAGLLQASQALDLDGPSVHPLYGERPDARRLAPELARRLAGGEECLLISAPGPGSERLAAGLRGLGSRRVRRVDPRPPPGRHAADHLLGALGSDAAPAVPRLTLDRARGRSLLADAGLPDQERAVALHPGAGSPDKCWPAERWAELGARLQRPVVLVEGPADESPVRAFLERRQAVVLRERPLVDLGCALSACSALLGHDSGVAHLAAALGTPVLALFGPSDPVRWSPRGPSVRVLRSEPAGRLDALGLEEVEQAARELLASPARRWPAGRTDRG